MQTINSAKTIQEAGSFVTKTNDLKGQQYKETEITKELEDIPIHIDSATDSTPYIPYLKKLLKAES